MFLESIPASIKIHKTERKENGAQAAEIRWPSHDGSVMENSMNEQQIKIPSEAECRRLVAGMGMLDNIVAHCRQVCRVSLLIVDHLKPDQLKPDGLNRDLIRAAALLHDITKTRSFQTQEDHAETGAKLLTEIGYPEVGRIVGQHVRLDRYFASAVTTEAEVVNYADKRVLHDRIVPLSERMGYILEKYGREPERKQKILLLWEKTEALEARLFAGLSFAPDDISRLLAEGPPGDLPEPAPRL
jgi:putative nucleotidyltransferase with HDIG domain